MLVLYRSWRALAAILLTLGACVLLGTARRGAVRLLVLDRLVARAPDAHGHRDRLARLHSLALRGPARGAPGRRAPAGGAREQAPAGHRLDLRGRRRLRRPRRLAASAPCARWACGPPPALLVTWVCCFTLFPALQKLLRTPTRRERALAGAWLLRSAETIPSLVVPLALAARHSPRSPSPPPGRRPSSACRACWRRCRWRRTRSTTSRPTRRVAEDARFFEGRVAGLKPLSLWISAADGSVVDPAFLAGLDDFAAALERDPRVGSVDGPARHPAAAALRRRPGRRARRAATAARRGGGRPRAAPAPGAGAARWVDMRSLRLDPARPCSPAPGRKVEIGELAPDLARLWDETASRHPALAGSRLRVVGQGLLSQKIADHLVPTLVHSFALTRGRDLRGVLPRLPQRGRAPAGDDPVALRGARDVPRDAALLGPPERGHHPHRDDRARGHRERPDPLLLAPAGAATRRPARGRRSSTRSAWRAARSSSRPS